MMDGKNTGSAGKPDALIRAQRETVRKIETGTGEIKNGIGRTFGLLKRMDEKLNAIGRCVYTQEAGGVRYMPFGVKDITTAQLADAYLKGLNLSQLAALSDGKYTPSQICVKLKRAGVMR